MGRKKRKKKIRKKVKIYKAKRTKEKTAFVQSINRLTTSQKISKQMK